MGRGQGGQNASAGSLDVLMPQYFNRQDLDAGMWSSHKGCERAGPVRKG